MKSGKAIAIPRIEMFEEFYMFDKHLKKNKWMLALITEPMKSSGKWTMLAKQWGQIHLHADL